MCLPYAGSPRLAQISIGGRLLRESIREHSHIRLRDLEYHEAARLLLAGGAVEDSLYRAL